MNIQNIQLDLQNNQLMAILMTANPQKYKEYSK